MKGTKQEQQRETKGGRTQENKSKRKMSTEQGLDSPSQKPSSGEPYVLI